MISAKANEVPGSTLRFIDDPALREPHRALPFRGVCLCPQPPWGRAACGPAGQVHVYARRHRGQSSRGLQVSCTPPRRPRCGCSCESPSYSCCSSTGSSLSPDRQHRPARWTQSLDRDKEGEQRGMRLEAEWPAGGWGSQFGKTAVSRTPTQAHGADAGLAFLSLSHYSLNMPFFKILSIYLLVCLNMLLKVLQTSPHRHPPPPLTSPILSPPPTMGYSLLMTLPLFCFLDFLTKVSSKYLILIRELFEISSWGSQHSSLPTNLLQRIHVPAQPSPSSNPFL